MVVASITIYFVDGPLLKNWSVWMSTWPRLSEYERDFVSFHLKGTVDMIFLFLFFWQTGVLALYSFDTLGLNWSFFFHFCTSCIFPFVLEILISDVCLNYDLALDVDQQFGSLSPWTYSLKQTHFIWDSDKTSCNKMAEGRRQRGRMTCVDIDQQDAVDL
jgi:hypothetical protein